MKKLSKVFLATLLVTTSLTLASCGGTTTEDVSQAETTQEPVATTEPEKISDEDLDKVLPVIESEEELPQLSPMEEGETIAIVKTSMGDITLRFFEEYAPKAVENFLTLAEEDYYDGITFHRVINDFMIQGGDPTGTGTGGESIYDGGKFDDEITPYLKHFSGAVAYANSGPDTNGSQFYIVENDKLSDEEIDYLEQMRDNPEGVAQVDSQTGTEIYNERYISPVVAQEYIDNGGTPFLDFNYTIFAQVIDGMDVVHSIADVETSDGTDGGQQDKPLEDVTINDIEISTYSSAQ